MAPLIMSLGRSPPIAQDAERKAMDLAQLHPARCDGAGKGMTKGLSWTATVLGKHMSKNQIIAVVAALVILIAFSFGLSAVEAVRKRLHSRHSRHLRSNKRLHSRSSPSCVAWLPI